MRTLLHLACLIVITTGGAAHSTAPPPACPSAPGAQGPQVWADREASIRHHAQLPGACLERLVRQCDATAEGGFLDGSDAATCSVRYEALLRHRFQGHFPSFLEWWRSASSTRLE